MIIGHEIRMYGFGEVALMYNPELKKPSALKAFNVWIDRSPGLRRKLENLGFRKGMRSLTPAMVEMIFEALGEP